MVSTYRSRSRQVVRKRIRHTFLTPQIRKVDLLRKYFGIDGVIYETELEQLDEMFVFLVVVYQQWRIVVNSLLIATEYLRGQTVPEQDKSASTRVRTGSPT